MKKLRDLQIPVILCSAKTHTEQQPIRSNLNLTDPYIVENGSAIIIPADTLTVDTATFSYPVEQREGEVIIRLGIPRAEIQQQLDDIRIVTNIEFQTFADLSVEEVAQITGLDHAGAKRARQRDYSATVVTQFSDIDRLRFQAACAAHHLKAPSGGRFMTITDSNADKGQAVRLLTRLYGAQWGDDIKTVGIGDSPNDLPMLAAMDIAYQVQRPDSTWRSLELTGLRRVPAPGPAGFSRMVEKHFS